MTVTQNVSIVNNISRLNRNKLPFEVPDFCFFYGSCDTFWCVFGFLTLFSVPLVQFEIKSDKFNVKKEKCFAKVFMAQEENWQPGR